ncbi:MAG: SAM-dependent methyltransferase [Propionibacteriales bacterium]|nr:SAM-dependent methyltransferase [Propionibacteriales bacterium]
MPDRTALSHWRDAWDVALYDDGGFFRREAPASHFRTAANDSVPFAAAIWRLVQELGHTAVVDMAAGRGELLAQLHVFSQGTLTLTGVEIGPRPQSLPPEVEWLSALPEHIDGLLIANEWLDNIPCDVVEVDETGTTRYVLVDKETGEEHLGEECRDPWLAKWWPLTEPGSRAEIGTTRDEAWSQAVARVDGTAIAIDYGHTRDDRPPFGSLRSYLEGRDVDVVPDGSRDVTAHVAVDAVAARCGATITRQRDALQALGVRGNRPPIGLASTDPTGYLAALAATSASAELLAHGGWGDFWWIRVDRESSMTD